MDFQCFINLLQGLSSSNNELRRETEKTYEELKQRDINSVVGYLCASLSSPNCTVDIRLQSGVLLRNVFRGFALRNLKSTDAIARINNESLILVNNSLFDRLEREDDSLVLRNVCDTAADIARGLLPNNQWPELKPKLFTMIQNDEPRILSAGLRTLGDLASCLEADFTQAPQQLLGIIRRALLFPNKKVQSDCIHFIAHIVEDNNRKVYKNIAPAIPLINEAILRLAAEDTDLATSVFESLIVIAETDASFFKSCFADTLNTALQIAALPALPEDLRQVAVEFLLCCAEDKPKTASAVPNFVPRMVQILLDFILKIKDDEFTEWMDTDAETRDSDSRLYDIGEEGLDRLAKAFEDEPDANVIGHVFNVIDKFVAHPEWQYQFAGLMAIAQTVEYLPEDSFEEYIDAIIKILLEKLNSPHKQLRFAACQALGQLALDHQPYVQERYYGDILPAMIKIMDDPHPRVQSHACSAFVNFAEEVEPQHLMPYADTIMQLLFHKCTPSKKIIVQQQAITGIAVIAGVLDTQFVKYYSAIMPILTNILTTATQKEARTCRGKAIECMSIIALSIGKEACGQHANEMLSLILPIWASDLEPDDPVREYSQEAVSRFARTLQEDFVPYLPHVVSPLLKILHKLPAHIPDDTLVQTDPEDMTYLMIANKCIGLKTSLIESQEQALALLGTLIDVLGENFKDYIQPTIMATMPLLNYVLSDDIKHAALAVLADLIKTTRQILDKHGGDRNMLTITLKTAAEKIFINLDETLADQNGIEQDLEAMIAGSAGLRQCILEAGPGVIDSETIQIYVEKIFSLMNQSNIRRRDRNAQRESTECDEDEAANIEDEQQQEQALRSSLLEILGAIMKHHKNEFLERSANICGEFVAALLTKNADADDRALAIYLCDDLIEQLGKEGISLWSCFLDEMINCIDDRKPSIRQAACYGMIHAARHQEFARFAESTTRRLAGMISRDRDSASREIQLANDNAVAALGEIIKHHANSLPQAEEYLHLWADYLPLKGDEEEAQRVHADLLRLVAENNPIILGPSNCNIPRVVGTFATIYKTGFSNGTIDAQIRALIEQLGEPALVDISPTLSKKQRNKLQKICKDIAEAKTNTNAI